MKAFIKSVSLLIFLALLFTMLPVYTMKAFAATTVTTLGTGFSSPEGVAVDSSGNIYVTENGNNSIKKMNSNGNNIVTLGSGFSHPMGVAVDSSGNIYVADFSNNAIKRMDSSGNNIVTLGLGFNGPVGVAVDSSGNIYVADSNNYAIKKMDSSGNNIVTLGSGFAAPTGVAVDSSGNIYVADNAHNDIKKMNSNGNNIVTLGSGFFTPESVAVDSSGNIYVADTGNAAIKKMNSNGNNIVTLGSGFSYPYGVAVDSSGNIYAVDYINSDIEKIQLSTSYTITYNGNDNTGGSVPTDSSTYASAATVTVLGNTGSLVKTGYTFAGWNTAADGSGTNYAAADTFTMSSSNVTLYAKWTANTPTNSYSVTYNGNGNTGGSVPTDSSTYASAATVTVLGNTGGLTKTGYTFTGWNTAADGTGTSYAAAASLTMGNSNVTLYAQWQSSTSQTVGLSLSAATYSVKESDGNLAVVVNRTGNTAQTASVNYATSDNTAKAGLNYIAAIGTLSFAAGDTNKTINIKINYDGVKVDGNTFKLTLSDPVGTPLGAISSAIVTIIDVYTGPDTVTPSAITAESPGTLQFSSATYTGYEGKNVGVTIVRTGGTKGTLGVNWSVTGGTAVSGTDYTPDTVNTSPLSFTDGESSKTLSFAIPAASSVSRAGKTIVLKLSSTTSSAILGSQISTTVTLSDYIPDTKTLKNTVKTLTASNPTLAISSGDSTEGLLLVALNNGASFNLPCGDSGITWNSANTKIATASSGLITAVGFGSTKVTATYGGKTATYTVNTALKDLSGVDSFGTTIKSGSTTPTLNLNLNSTDTILPLATDVNSVQAYVYSGALWTTSSSKVATVGSSSGVITTTGTPGTCTITGTYGSKKLTAKINTVLTAMTLSYPVSNTPIVLVTTSATTTTPAGLQMKLGDVSAALVLTTTMATTAKLDVASNSATVWSSSNKKVATVGATGVVTTTTTPGTAIITGTYAGKKAQISVNTKLINLAVTYPSDLTTSAAIFTSATSASSPAGLGMELSDVSAPLILTASYANGTTANVATDKSTVWTTSNKKVATVTAGAITTTSTGGTATITGAYAGKKVTVKVTTTLTKLSANNTTIDLKPGGATATVVLTVYYSNNASANITTSSAIWSTSNSKVATVSNGVITPVGSGTATITAKYGGKTVTISVNTSITLTLSDVSVALTVGATKTPTVTATYSDGTTEDVTTKATWASSNTLIASVSSGQIKGVKAGTATINVTYFGVKKSVAVTVS